MKRRGNPPATTVLIIVCILIYLAENFMPMDVSDAGKAILFGAYYKTLIVAGEYWRLFTVGFLHTAFLHVMMNMYSLQNLGRVLEVRLGTGRFLTILFCSILGGSLFMFIMEGNAVGVGLSGGLYGLMAALILILFKNGSWKHPVLRAYLFQIVIINVMINFVPGIAYTAHLGGFLTGLLVTLLLDKEESFAKVRIHALIAGAALLGVLFWKIPDAAYIRKDERYLGTDREILTYYRDHGLSSHAYNTARRIDRLYDTIYLEEVLKED